MNRWILLFAVACGPRHTTPTPAVSAPAEDVVFTQLAPTVWMHTSVQVLERWGSVPSNGLVITTGAGTVLVDTAWNDAQTDQILDWAAETLGEPVRHAVFTHAHDDKMGGVAALHARNVATWAHPLSNELAPQRTLTPAQHDLPADLAFHPAVDVFHPGAGHTTDNLVVRVVNTPVLFGGCLIRPGSATGMGNTADGDVSTWAAAVQAVRERHPDASIVVPSHGPPGEATLLEHTIRLADQANAAD